MALTCPKGMKLITEVKADERKFCIDITETTQAGAKSFWGARSQSSFEMLVKGTDGSIVRETGKKENSLRREAAKEIRKSSVASVTVQKGSHGQPTEGPRAGANMAAVNRSWQDARTYCQNVYKGGDLPTKKQWDTACGNGEFCTKSGTKEKLDEEADYGRDFSAAPLHVKAYPSNPTGIYGMSGGVWEMTLEDDEGSKKKFILRGGSWGNETKDVRADSQHSTLKKGPQGHAIGWRCVAPPVVSQDEKAKEEAFPEMREEYEQW